MANSASQAEGTSCEGLASTDEVALAAVEKSAQALASTDGVALCAVENSVQASAISSAAGVHTCNAARNEWPAITEAESQVVVSSPPDRAVAIDAGEECAVCFEIMGDACPVRKLSCGHSYHHACIQKWLQRNASCPICKADEPADFESVAPAPSFHIDLGHQEMCRVVQELEDIFCAVHEVAGADHPVAVSGLAFNLCASLGYEDEDELEEALGGSLADFLAALPHFDIVWPQVATAVADDSACAAEPKALMRPEPSQDTSLSGKRIVFTVSERSDLWRVVLQGPRATVEIPEIEFAIRPDSKRRIDTIYNMIAAAVYNLGDHVRMNTLLQGNLGEDEATKICAAIDSLNRLLDLDQTFTFVVSDPQGLSELKPLDGAHTSSYIEAEESAPADQEAAIS